MNQNRDFLESRKQYLLSLQKEKKKALQRAPSEKLRICSSHGRVQYYLRTDSKDLNGTYLSKTNISFIKKLAQKDYNTQVLHAAEQELLAIQKYLSACPDKTAEDVYESLHPERQKLVTPIYLSDEAYLQAWESITYEGKGFYDNQAEYLTLKGERVRSKSEIIIANALERKHVPYRYEYPLHLKGGITVHPDFTVLNIAQRKELYWEHLGMMDTPQYAENAITKISTYAQNAIYPGDQLILTFETNQSPLNQKLILQFIEKYLR